MSKLNSDNQDVYQQNGFTDRKDYLENLAEEYGDVVFDLAEILGESEDFDGLVTSLEDFLS
jgi:hypothetical protein